MTEPGAGGVIDFYFDFISPYGYFAAMQIEALARRYNHTVRWHAFRVGVVVVKVMGLRPLLDTPLKNDYVRHDIDRLATMYGLPIAASAKVPDPVFLGSAFYAVEQTHAGSLAGFAKQLYARIWTGGEEISDVAQLHAIARFAGFAGFDSDRLFSPSAMETGRLKLKAATGKAIARGVFGSPSFVVGSEIIWGVDRLWMLEHFLQKSS